MTRPAISPALIVHGGAGAFDEDRRERAVAGCERAVLAGLEVLARGGSALDAVQRATRVLEDEPVLNAGTGAALTCAGTVEVDASIMDGASLRFGAVASVSNCGRAVDLARAVLDDGRHALLCGEGAWAFARERGFSPDDPETLIQGYRRRQLEQMRQEGGNTVGACAVDSRGQVAAATSTGGTTGKRPGRIGDTPLPGCGTYADRRAAASTTGHGELLMRITATRVCVDACEGASPTAAIATALAAADAAGGGDAGFIAVATDGRVGAGHNTTEMPFAAGELQDGQARLFASGVRLPLGTDLEGHRRAAGQAAFART